MNHPFKAFSGHPQTIEQLVTALKQFTAAKMEELITLENNSSSALPRLATLDFSNAQVALIAGKVTHYAISRLWPLYAYS
jgi:hypothetical protein